MNIARIALGAVIVSASLLLSGCATAAGEPALPTTATPTPSPTPTPDTAVTDLVIWGNRIDSQNAAGDIIGTVALGGTDAAPIISFLSAALGSAPALEERGDDAGCRPGSYATWASAAPDGKGVQVYAAGADADGVPPAVVVKFEAPDTNGIDLSTGFGAQIGDDVSAYLASDDVLVVQEMFPPSAAEVESGKTLASPDLGIFIFNVVSTTDNGSPVGVVSYIGEPGILNGSIAPGSWSAGHC